MSTLLSNLLPKLNERKLTMKKDYTLFVFETTLVFVITLALYIGFGIFLYVTDDKPKLETIEMTQIEETLNTSNYL